MGDSDGTAARCSVAAALSFVGAPAAFEAALCRLTGGPLDAVHAIGIGVPWALLSLLVYLGSGRRSPLPGAAARALVVAFYAVGILVGVSLQTAEAWLVLNLSGVGIILVIGLGPALRGRPVEWGPRVPLAACAVATAVVLALLYGSSGVKPSAALIAGLLGLCAGGLLLGRWAFVLILIGGLPSLESETWRADSRPAPPLPDVVLISIDTLRLDDAREMDCVSGLVADGGVLLEAQAPSPWTLPSIATLLTGRDPASHGALRTDGYSRLAASVPTLAERLAEVGYDTAATAENPFTGPRFGLERGFARFRHDDARPWAIPRLPMAVRAQPVGSSLLAFLGGPPTAFGVDLRLAEASELLALRRDRPLFLWIHLLDPHLPYTHVFAMEGVSLTQRMALFTARRTSLALPDPATLELYRRAYRHEVAVVDRSLSAWLDRLPASPHGRIVVVTSDHGEAFGEHGGWEHGHSMYQELLSVPLVILGIDGIDPGGPVGLVDVVPTILAALGLDASGLDGQDLRAHSRVPYPSVNPLYGEADLRAVRLGSAKLIAVGDERAAFDLVADPQELEPTGSRALEPLLPGPDLATRPAVELDPVVIEQLRGLGYLE